MGLSKVFERLYLKVYVGIVIKLERIEIVIELVKGDKVKERITETFKREPKYTRVQKFMTPYLDETPFHYIAFLNPVEIQGALPTCLRREAAEFTDLSTSITLCQDQRWMVYADKPSLDAFKKEYRSIGVDLVFSPFLVIRQFFHDKVFGELALFVLIEDERVSVCVFDQGDLLFAEYLSMDDAVEDSLLIEGDDEMAAGLDLDLDDLDLDDGIDLDDLDAIEDLDGLDDLQAIEDLDALEEIEEFSDKRSNMVEDREKTTQVETKDTKVTLDAFDDDFKRFGLIQGSLQHYYSDGRYKSHFIESIYLADSCEVSDDLKHYLEEELFLKVYIRRIDLAAEIVDLAKKEVEDAS